MLDPEKTLEREALLKRLRELNEEIAEGKRRMWEYKKSLVERLPLEKQFEFYLTEYLRGESSGHFAKDLPPEAKKHL